MDPCRVEGLGCKVRLPALHPNPRAGSRMARCEEFTTPPHSHPISDRVGFGRPVCILLLIPPQATTEEVEPERHHLCAVVVGEEMSGVWDGDEFCGGTGCGVGGGDLLAVIDRY